MAVPTHVRIRPPQLGDGAGLAECWLDAADYYARLNPELFQLPAVDGLGQWCEGWALISEAASTLLVADDHGRVIGFIGATIHPPLADAARQFVRDVGVTRLVINALVVQQAYWRQGIGTLLMDAAEAWGRSQGALVALLDTYTESPVSVPFYEQRMGYRRRALHFRKTLV